MALGVDQWIHNVQNSTNLYSSKGARVLSHMLANEVLYSCSISTELYQAHRKFFTSLSRKSPSTIETEHKQVLADCQGLRRLRLSFIDDENFYILPARTEFG